MTLAEAGAAMNVGARTVGRWESGTELPESAVPVVEQFLNSARPEDVGPTLRAASKWELLAELARRLEEGGRRGDAPDLVAGVNYPYPDEVDDAGQAGKRQRRPETG